MFYNQNFPGGIILLIKSVHSLHKVGSNLVCHTINTELREDADWTMA